MALRRTLLYRGSLDACNFSCGYCPFAHRQATPASLAADAGELAQFEAWLEEHGDPAWALFFTPRGEALVHRHYQQALARLSHRFAKVAIQTNLSGDLDWLGQANPSRLAFWCSYHPADASLETFVEQCRRLEQAGCKFSVGMVGKRDLFPEIQRLRAALPAQVYLWINAFRHDPVGYTAAEIDWLTGLDPLFPSNLHPHLTAGAACACGATVFSVEGTGEVRRCHFDPGRLGNLYRDGIPFRDSPTPCRMASCHCHIGYVHLVRLGLEQWFGDGILERVPCGFPE